MKGKVTFENRRNGGALFSVTLPVEISGIEDIGKQDSRE